MRKGLPRTREPVGFPGLRRAVLLCGTLLLGACAAERSAAPPGETPGPPAAAAERARLWPELPPRVTLVGVRPAELERMLGRPSLRRREPPAEYWRYSFTGCTLDVFLYREPDFRKTRVIYFEFRNVMRAPGLDGCAEFAARFEPPGLPEVREH